MGVREIYNDMIGAHIVTDDARRFLADQPLRNVVELLDREALLPANAALPFGAGEAVIAAGLYRRVARPRQRERDLAIAAVAIAHDVQLWTLNADDFRDVPGLRLYTPPA